MSFRFDGFNLQWSWTNVPIIACVLVIDGLVLGVLAITVNDRQLALLNWKIIEYARSEEKLIC